jgi:pimeloyl-ACP methyl ester carboxylesterase
MPFLERHNAKIYYDLLPAQQDSLEPHIVTLINGHTRSSGDFRLLARELTAAGISCLLLDNRSSGKSTNSAPEFSVTDMENDVVALWDHLSITKSSILGISMGGFIAQAIAARFSDRVKKLILISTAANQKWIKKTKGEWIDSIGAIEDKLAAYFAPEFIVRNKLLFETMVRQTHKAILEGAFEERARQQKIALQNATITWNHSSINAETLIIHGDKDQIISVDAAKDLNRLVHHSTLLIMPDVGHLILAESPRALYKNSISWLLSSTTCL